VINAGHKWNGAVTRCEGDPPEPRQFPVFGPAAFAGIGKLPGTIADRCVIIPMRRAKKGETASRLGVDCAPLLAPLAGRVARWAKDNREAVRVGKPELPESLYNRAADNWRPLCAIADVLGGEWPKRARKAAVELSVADDSQSIGVKLLDDIRRVFAEDEAKPEALDSAVIVSRLNNMADRPWPELAKGKPLTQAKMARMLREFGVGSMLIGRQRLAGYALAAFQDAFERYLPPGPPS
jgi:hypothetical protein